MPRLALMLLLMLVPIAAYLGILGWINRRSRGLLVSGPWDFVGVLFAASGFLLFGGPWLLDTLSQTSLWRDLWIGKNAGDQPLEDRLATGRFVLYAGYYFLVILCAGFLLWNCRRLTAIYNVHPQLVEQVLGQALEQSGLTFVQTGNILLIEPVDDGAEAPPSVETVRVKRLSPGTIRIQRVTTLEVEASAGMSHVTLMWSPPDSLLRREVELQLRRALVQHQAPENNVGDWLLLLSSCLFFLVLVGAGALIILQLMRN